MIPQFSNNVLSSFFFWAQHEITQLGQAYRNKTGSLYYQADPRLSGFHTYSSPFKQWVYDKGVSGAIICESVMDSAGISYTRASGIKIDYENGRVLFPTSFGTGLSLSGAYSFPDFNFYTTNETQESLLTRETNYTNPRFGNNGTTPVSPYSQMTPAAFVTIMNSDNSPFALGGTDLTKVNGSIVFMAETDYAIEAALSIMRDSRYKSIPFVSINEDPLNEYNDVKSSILPTGYNYESIKHNATPGSLLEISFVQCSRVNDRINVDKQIFIGLVDIEIEKVRNPRI